MDISPLSRLGHLRSLTLAGMTSLTNIAPLSGLNTIWRLSLAECIRISDFNSIASLHSLNILDLSGLTQIKNISFLEHLNGISELTLFDIGDLDDPNSDVNSLTESCCPSW